MRNRSILAPERGLLYGYLTPLLTIGLFIMLIGISIVSLLYRTRVDVGYLMVEEIAALDDIFKRIEASCSIIDFDSQKNPINFLTIKKDGFVGSELGSMNVVYPDKWEGPYLHNNPTMFAKEYQVVRTHAGYFITPGDGVKLPNGKVIGKDLILDENADIFSMMQDEKALRFKDRPLAAPIIMKHSRLRAIPAEGWMEVRQEWGRSSPSGSGAHVACITASAKTVS